jgi:hypothetical protein
MSNHLAPCPENHSDISWELTVTVYRSYSRRFCSVSLDNALVAAAAVCVIQQTDDGASLNDLVKKRVFVDVY